MELEDLTPQPDIAERFALAQASLRSMSPKQFVDYVTQVRELLPVRSTQSVAYFEHEITDDYIQCAYCGKHLKNLTVSHLAGHGTNPDEYRRTFGLSPDTVLMCGNERKRRSSCIIEKSPWELRRRAVKQSLEEAVDYFEAHFEGERQ